MIIVFSGPSGSGKTTIMKKVVRDDGRIKLSRSYTTRRMRDGEVNGVDYNFVVPELFERMKREGRFVEANEVYGNWYGTPIPDPELVGTGDLALEIDYQGADDVRRWYPRSRSIYIYSTISELKARLQVRGDTPEQVALRLVSVETELQQMGRYDAWVHNRSVNQVVAEILGLITLWRHGLDTPACYRDRSLLHVPQLTTLG